MKAIDAVVVAIFFSLTGGVLAYRTVRAWRRFRLQERTTSLLIAGVRILEEPREAASSRRDDRP